MNFNATKYSKNPLLLLILSLLVGCSGQSRSVADVSCSAQPEALTPVKKANLGFKLKLLPEVENRRKYYVPVFYATDRNQVPTEGNAEIFGAEREKELKYGVIYVEIPHGKNRKRDDLNACGDMEKCFSIRGKQKFDDLDRMLGVMFKEDLIAPNDLLIFIHGFNTSFLESVFQTAQLSYDLNFKGTAVTYSWASGKGISGYPHDKTKNAQTVSKLVYFLSENIKKKQEGTAGKIHLIAHSMGSEALTLALVELSQQYKGPVFGQVILAAPDVDTAIFEEQRAPRIRGMAERFTVYTSENDWALGLSAEFWGGEPRLGLAGKKLFVMDGFETIDATDGIQKGDTGPFSVEVGHSYFAESLVDDIFHLIQHGDSPFDRNLREEEKQGLQYWRLRN